MSPRLLVTLRHRPGLTAALSEQLPRGSWQYPHPRPSRAGFPGIEAALVGDLDRELPGWAPSDFPALRFVQCVYAGVDHLPIFRLPSTVRVAGNSGGYDEPVAEHAVALALAAAKRLRSGQAQVERGQLRPARSSRMLLGASALVLGVGGIGRAVGRRLAALGMRVDGVNRRGHPLPGFRRIFRVRELHRALGRADLVVNCLPLSRETTGLIGSKEFHVLAPGALYVNVGRAETTDPAALEEWLRKDDGNAAGIDVWWAEEFAAGRVTPRPSLLELSNLIGTPHTAAVADGSRDHALACAVQNVARFLEGRPPRGIVDRADYPGRIRTTQSQPQSSGGRSRRDPGSSGGAGRPKSRRARSAP